MLFQPESRVNPKPGEVEFHEVTIEPSGLDHVHKPLDFLKEEHKTSLRVPAKHKAKDAGRMPASRPGQP
jgi:hypothetical protein